MIILKILESKNGKEEFQKIHLGRVERLVPGAF